jgi:putative nucleotidyltransferase with HDIG domain
LNVNRPGIMAVEALIARAPYASDPARSRGRVHREPASPTRNDFRRDCDRIIHSTAFRRLAHKTQVFVFHEGDHFRTRLTHTLEVAQIARSLARALGLDEDLAESLALAHDLGHPPFGHAGERALDRCLANFGGFDHNAQTLRVVTALERRYAAFDGLNLTWETVEGLVKHNGPLVDRHGAPIGRYREHGLPHAIRMHAQDPGPSTISSCGVGPAPRRKSPRSPTISPTTPTTSTTAYAPACSASTIWPASRWSPTSSTRSAAPMARSRRAGARTSWCAA